MNIVMAGSCSVCCSVVPAAVRLERSERKKNAQRATGLALGTWRVGERSCASSPEKAGRDVAWEVFDLLWGRSIEWFPG